MPRIISDELFDSLMECVKAQRLLGVMGLLERCQSESEWVEFDGWEQSTDESGLGSRHKIYVGAPDDDPKTNNN